MYGITVVLLSFSTFLCILTHPPLYSIHCRDYDIDCAGDLVCWYEDGSGTVPGCSGTPRRYWEYCIDPSVIPRKNVTHSDMLVDFGNGLGPAALGRCQGDW